jgi:cell division protein FtsZ
MIRTGPAGSRRLGADHSLADIKMCQVDAPELDDRALVTVLASGFTAGSGSQQFERPVEVCNSNPEPSRTVNGDSGRIYGDAPAGAHQASEMVPATPTRLLPQAPTPSGELASMAEDLHVPAIIRMTQGRMFE